MDGFNEYPQSMFWIKNTKKYTTVRPSFILTGIHFITRISLRDTSRCIKGRKGEKKTTLEVKKISRVSANMPKKIRVGR